MSALDFIKSDDTFNVAFGDIAATPGEDAVVRGSEHRFGGSGYVSVPSVKGFSKAPGSRISIRRSNRRLKGADQPSGSEAIDISDDIEVSAEQVLEVEVGKGKGKEKELVVSGKRRSWSRKVPLLPSRVHQARVLKAWRVQKLKQFMFLTGMLRLGMLQGPNCLW
ncbi:hypothetical protein HanPSC8_Chr13g0560951 [Helianthus annuus]|nr:hypothetical protein HanPSC8_Chr13g0560951 [Helianthus annuus]